MIGESAMLKTSPKKPIDQIARRGRALYTKQIHRKLAGEKKGRVVAVDILSADYQVADSALAAARQLLARKPHAQIWLERIGYPALRRFGSWRGEEART
jgi:hypothetical protein